MVKSLPVMWETQVQSLGQKDLPEKEMATHFNIRVWEIPWTEESGGLQSVGSRKSQNDLATKPPANLGWFDVKIHILFTSYVSSDLKNRGKKFWQAQMQKWDGRIRAIENNFVKNEYKYFCFKSWHESRKVFQKYRNENSCPNFIVFNFLNKFFVKIQLYHSSYNIFTSSLNSHTLVITPTRKPSLGNSGMFFLLEFSDDFAYSFQWL